MIEGCLAAQLAMRLQPRVNDNIHISQALELIFINDQGVLARIGSPIHTSNVIPGNVGSATEEIETLSTLIGLDRPSEGACSPRVNGHSTYRLNSGMGNDE